MDAWAKLPKNILEAGRTFNTQVAKGLQESDWDGDTAEAAFTEIRGLGYQIDNAESEAESVHKFLNSCLKAFRAAKRDLDTITEEIAGHEHLSVNPESGSVYVDSGKVEPDAFADLDEAYQPTIKAYKERTRKALEDARETDSTFLWSLRDMSDSYDIGFLPTAAVSLAEARTMRKERGRESGMEASSMETSGGGLHRKPTLMNQAGKLGGKVFGFPASVVATGPDFYYTPAQSSSERPDAKIMAPRDPGKVHWK